MGASGRTRGERQEYLQGVLGAGRGWKAREEGQDQVTKGLGSPAQEPISQSAPTITTPFVAKWPDQLPISWSTGHTGRVLK